MSAAGAVLIHTVVHVCPSEYTFKSESTDPHPSLPLAIYVKTYSCPEKGSAKGFVFVPFWGCRCLLWRPSSRRSARLSNTVSADWRPAAMHRIATALACNEAQINALSHAVMAQARKLRKSSSRG